MRSAQPVVVRGVGRWAHGIEESAHAVYCHEALGFCYFKHAYAIALYGIEAAPFGATLNRHICLKYRLLLHVTTIEVCE